MIRDYIIFSMAQLMDFVKDHWKKKYKSYIICIKLNMPMNIQRYFTCTPFHEIQLVPYHQLQKQTEDIVCEMLRRVCQFHVIAMFDKALY